MNEVNINDNSFNGMNDYKKNNKSNNFKSCQQQIKREQIQAEHIAQLPNKMKKAIENYATPQKQARQEIPNKPTKIKKDSKLFELTPKNITSMIEDAANGELDGKIFSNEEQFPDLNFNLQQEFFISDIINNPVLQEEDPDDYDSSSDSSYDSDFDRGKKIIYNKR